MSEYDQTVERNQEEGSIGIGAMIVFIALILVAAVASTIIIKTAEELQQNAESTSDDTRKEISGKVNIVQVIVNGTDGTEIKSLAVTAKIAAGSSDVQVQDIEWVITCNNAGTFGLTSGNLGHNDSAGGELDVSNGGADGGINADYISGVDYAATDELPAGTVFKFDIDLYNGGTTGNVADSGVCKDAAIVNAVLEMKMIVDGGGTTVIELQIDTVVSGKEVT